VQPFTPALWIALVATVFVMAMFLYLFSHLSVRGGYAVRRPREGGRHCPGLPVTMNMAARALATNPPSHSQPCQVMGSSARLTMYGKAEPTSDHNSLRSYRKTNIEHNAKDVTAHNYSPQ
jgi:hypothetical protein